MTYRHETVRGAYGDLASGAVLRSAPGFPAFPVRLASEVLQTALELRPTSAPATVWDPCCGSGYLLTVLALLHRPSLAGLLASDVDEAALDLARANLGLLTGAGLDTRARELAQRAEAFDKPHYAEAAAAAHRLRARLDAAGGPLPYAVRRADVFDRVALTEAVAGMTPDLVVTDLPYGEQTSWQGERAGEGLPGMLTRVASVLPPTGVLAVVLRGRKVPPVGEVRPRRRLRVGTRAAAFFVAGDLTGVPAT
ncbi:rRNA methyltransferase aviRa [Micromonospora sp. ATCC 39149]|uniref:rRNA methyltransferase n=1 Tax=Micromonospora carbonacea TaxID=47853 RepID=A0A7D5YJF3_9ACTN|nr:rRNA methyltransferase [Micromonospora sp. ATCC 39149]EEP73347.1 rRNA methyltransferase aviRa [Micromonospora sp. ATCC 39149]QLJ99354.1 rRNA methyltransferase [Micromonospora carbonacea]